MGLLRRRWIGSLLCRFDVAVAPTLLVFSPQDRKMNATLSNSSFNELPWQFTVHPPIIISIHIVNFVLGFPLNIYIIVLLFPRRGVIEASDVFSLNQALVEMFFVLLAPFHSLCSVSMTTCLLKPFGFLLGVSMASRCLFQCCVSLERYLAVVHPVVYLRYRPPRYRVAWSIMNWTHALVFGVFCALTFPFIPYTFLSVIYILMLTLNAFCCLSVLKKLRHPGPRDRESEEMEVSAAKRKAFQIVSINLLLFLTQNLPIALAFGLSPVLPRHDFGMAVLITLGINTVTGLSQPVFVLHKAGRLSGVWSVVKGRSSLICLSSKNTTTAL